MKRIIFIITVLFFAANLISFTPPDEEDLKIKLIFKSEKDNAQCRTVFNIVMNGSGSGEKVVAFGTSKICPDKPIEKEKIAETLKNRKIWKTDVDSPNDLYRTITRDEETFEKFVEAYKKLMEQQALATKN